MKKTAIAKYFLALGVPLASGFLPAFGQTPVLPTNPNATAGRGRPAGGGLGGGYTPRPPADPAKVERGKALFGVQCTFCHGADARGGEGGPNLVRSGLVLNDIDGELLAPVILNGRQDRGMPRFDLSKSQISDLAAFIHSFRVGGRDAVRNAPPTILVGDAKAGESYFKATCAACHSVTGDLKGIASKIADPKALQQTWIMPGAGRGFGPQVAAPVVVPPKTVTVTLASGEKFTGRLDRIDDFTVTLTEPNSVPRTFPRNGATPKVEVHDPLGPHKDLLKKYSDADIHNITAYLVTLK